MIGGNKVMITVTKKALSYRIELVTCYSVNQICNPSHVHWTFIVLILLTRYLWDWKLILHSQNS